MNIEKNFPIPTQAGSRLTARASLLTLLLVSAVAVSPRLQAAQRTWSGGGPDYNWGTAANWGGTIPGTGDSLIFAGSTKLTNYNNLSGLVLTGITFNNSDFLFGGTLITNSGGIYDNAGYNTNNLAVYLNGSQGITNAVSGTPLQFGGIQTNMATGNIITFGGPGNIYMNGVISGYATFYANGDGSGNGFVRLAAANTFTGPVTVNSGTLQFGNASAIPSGAGKGDVTNNATIDLNGYSPSINNLFGNSSGVVDNKTGTSTYTLTIGNNATNTGGWFEYDGVIQNSSGSVALTKVNTNIFYLNGGSDSYSGRTTISAGKMILGPNATLANSSAILVSQGAQLDVSAQSALSLGSSQYLYAGRNTNGGSGDILGSVDNSGALVILNPAVAGTLNITNNLTLENGSVVSFDLAPTNYVGGGSNDLITINGTLALNGGTIALNPYAGTFATGAYGTYTLITNSQALETGSAANMTVAVPRGVTPTLDDTTYPGSLLVHLTGSGVPVSLVWNGQSSGANWDVQQTQDWLNNGAADYFYYLDNVVFNDAGNGAVNVATGVSPSSTTFNNNTNNYVLTGSGAISGGGGLTLNGSGTVTLTLPNTFTGDTTINNGTLALGLYNVGTYFINIVLYNGVNPGALNMGGGIITMNGANYSNDTDTFSSLNLLAGSSSIRQENRGSSAFPVYQFNNLTRKVGATLNIDNLQTKSGSHGGLYFAATVATNNGILGGFAEYQLNDWAVPSNAGTGTSVYGGYENSNSPTLWGAASNIVLSATPAANVGSQVVNSLKFTGASTVTINSGSVLQLASGGILMPYTGAGTVLFTGGTLEGAPSADLIVHQNTAASTLTIASTIADNVGSTALTKSGQGTLILAGANTYSGVTYINGQTIYGPYPATKPTYLPLGLLQVGTGGTTGDLGNTTGVTNNGYLGFFRSDAISLNLPVTGSGGLKQLGSGILTLPNNMGYSGPTVISAGTLQVGTGGSTGNLGTSSSITNNSRLVINRSAALTINATINGSGSLIQMGNSVLTLTNVNLYSGLTVVSNGTLALSASSSIAQSAAIDLAASGTTLDVSAVSGGIALTGGSVGQVLAGFGTVNGSVTATNNTLVTPGTNGVAGTLTINNNFTLAGGTLFLDVGTSSKDLLAVGGALNLNSGVITLNTLNTLANGTYKLISYGSFGGSVANVSFAGFNQAGQLAYITNNTSGNEIDLVIYNGAGAYLTWVGDGGNNYWDVTTSANWNNGAGASDFHNNDNVIFNDSSANTTVNLNAGVTPASVTINTLANNYTFAGSGDLAGGGSVIINATNTTVIITAPFQNSGRTIINTGTVQVGNGSAEGSLGIGVVTNNGAINFNEPNDSVFSGSLAGSGLLFQSGSTMLTLNGNNSAYLGSITINSGVLDLGGGTSSGVFGSGPVTNNGTLNIDRSGSLTLNNNITGSGPVAFIGGGTVTFGGNNTYANNTYISNGIVKLGSATAFFSDGSAADWLVLDGASSGNAGTLDLNGESVAVNALAGVNATENGLIEDSAASTTSLLSIIGSATTTYAGTIQDNGGSGGKVSLFIGGAANQTIDVESAAGNTYSGGTTISNATVTLTSSRNGNSANYTTPVGLGTGTINLMSNATLYAVGAYNQSEGPTWSCLANTINIAAGQAATIHGPQRGTMLGSVTGAGTLNYVTAYVRGVISGDWSGFTGQIIFSADPTGGQLGIANTKGLGKVLCTNTGSSGVTFYNTVAGTPTIPIGELADDGSAYIESTSSGNAGGAAANFAVGGLNTSVTFGGGIIDNVGIIKVGTGSWTLTNASLTYSGQTTVSNGTLVLGASAPLPNSTPIAIHSPGILDVTAAGTFNLGNSTAQTLEGTGTVNGGLNVGGSGTVSPGAAGANSIGTLTVSGAVTLGGTIIMELNRTNTPATNDMLSAASIAAGGTLQVNNLGPDLHTGDTFKLFSVPVTGLFTATNLPVTTANGSITYVWSNNVAVDGTISVVVGAPNKATNPTNITAVLTGTQLVLSWPSDHLGWYLQAQTNALGAGLGSHWVDVPGATNYAGFTNAIIGTNPTVFYRLSLNP
jgi:autotransporter-associated beta strand protein